MHCNIGALNSFVRLIVQFSSLMNNSLNVFNNSYFGKKIQILSSTSFCQGVFPTLIDQVKELDQVQCYKCVFTCVCMCTHMCLCVCVCACMHACLLNMSMCTDMHTHGHVITWQWECACICVCVYVCLCFYRCIYLLSMLEMYLSRYPCTRELFCNYNKAIRDDRPSLAMWCNNAYFHHNTRLMLWHTLMAYFAMSLNGEES